MNILHDHKTLQKNHNTMFCDFIEIEPTFYKCTKCGTIVESMDLQPPNLPCSATITETDPNWLDKIKNFSKSMMDHASNGFAMATDDDIRHRYEICSTCEFFKNSTCSKCGCPLYRTKNYISKLSWASEKCPVDKW